MRYHLSCLRLVNSKITEQPRVSLSFVHSTSPSVSVFRPPLLSQIPDNVAVLETVDEGLEVDGGALEGIQCVNCGV